MHFQDAFWVQLAPSNIFQSSHWRSLTSVYLGMFYLISLLNRFYALKKQYHFTFYSEYVVTTYETRGLEQLKFCSGTLQYRSFQLMSSADCWSQPHYAYCSGNSSPIKMWITKWLHRDHVVLVSTDVPMSLWVCLGWIKYIWAVSWQI